MKSKKNIALRVKNLIEKCGTRSPYELCKKLDITIMYRDIGEVKGFFKKVLNKKYIVVNELLDEISQELVLCHELGHAYLHSSEETLFLKSGLGYSNIFEDEANLFALELLKRRYNVIPEEVIEKCDLGRQDWENLLNLIYK